MDSKIGELCESIVREGRQAMGMKGEEGRYGLIIRSTGDHLASLAYEGLDTGCSCRSERITTLQVGLAVGFR
jgi:hypothetical protein